MGLGYGAADLDSLNGSESNGHRVLFEITGYSGLEHFA